MAKKRILFVDDEPSLRVTIPAILEMHGYELMAAATVPEALEMIQHNEFDVLLSDLNIGQPGDGFTVVSAMRRTQPTAVTFIITGFPDFETALSAIRNQVDGYFVKPTDMKYLVEQIEAKLGNAMGRHLPPATKRVSQIIRECKDEIIEDWMELVEANPEIASVPLSRPERMDYVPKVLRELADRVEGGREDSSEKAIEAAEEHGRTRYEQAYTIPQIMIETRLLQRVLSHNIQLHLLSLDISTVIPDMMRTGESLTSFIEESVRSYQEAERRAIMRKRHRGKQPDLD